MRGIAARVLGVLALAGTLALGVGVAAASADQVNAAPPASSSVAGATQSGVSATPNGGWDWWM